MSARDEETASSGIYLTYVAVNIVQRNNVPYVAAAVITRSVADTALDDLLQTHETVNECADGVTAADQAKAQPSKGRIQLFEFFDNAQYSYFDAFLTQIGQAQLFIAEEAIDKLTAEGRKVSNLLEGERQWGLELTPLRKSCFSKNSDAAMATVMQLVGHIASHCTNTITSEMPVALACVDCLAQQLQLVAEVSDSTMLYEVSFGALDVYMRLDSAAADAVNLLPKADHPTQFGSLYGVLNRCRTKQGSRLLERWLRQPLLDAAQINERLDMVQLFLQHTMQRNELRDGPLKSMPDLTAIIAKLHKKRQQGSAGGLSELFRLYAFARSVPGCGRILEDLLAQDSFEADGPAATATAANTDKDADAVDDDAAAASAAATAGEVMRRKYIQPLQQIEEKFALFEQLVEHVVDLDALPELRVNASHDEQLLEIADELADVEAAAQRLFEEARGSWASFTDVKLETDSPHGIIMRTTRGDDERQLRCAEASSCDAIMQW